MSFYTPYKFKRTRREKLDEKKRRLPQSFGKERLSGFIGDATVSEDEERAFIALKKLNLGVQHQFPVKVFTNKPGDAKFVDFIVGIPPTPLEVYGEIGHSTQADIDKDNWREDQINQELIPKGYRPLQIARWYELETIDQAVAKMEELFT